MLQPDWYPRAIIWDLDGTLVESAPDIATALNILLNEQGMNGYQIPAVRMMIGGGVAKLIERAYRLSGDPLDETKRDALVSRFMEIYGGCATDNTHLVPHARKALTHFYNAGVRQGLCTNKPEAVTRQILNALDVSGFFVSVVGGDSTSEKKPHPLPLITCLEELDTAPGDALMIGDTAADVGAARAANTPVILVPDGYTGANAETLGADFVLNDLATLPATIDHLFSARMAS
jgi:phosphoglycolate phosphatase